MPEANVLLPKSALVVDSSFTSRKQLIADLEQSSLVHEIIEAQSVANGLEILISRVLELCVIGPSLSEASAIDFVRRAKPLVAEKNCAFVAVVHHERGSAEAFLEAGADGAIELPYSALTFTSIVTEAIQVARTLKHETLKTPEERIESLLRAQSPDALPASLARTAKRFRSIAAEITSGRLRLLANGDPSVPTKEALRSALESALSIDSFEASVPGTFDFYLVQSLVEWFTERVHHSEKDCTEKLRRKLLAFR